MATGVGMGFDLSKLEKQFEKLDKQLEKLMKDGKTFEQNMNSIFQNMGKQGLQNFSNQLGALRKNIVAFGKQKVGLKWDSVGLRKYIDDVNRLIYVIQHVQKETKKQGIKGASITGLRKEVKDAQELLRLVKQTEKEISNSTKNRQQTYSGALRYSANVKNLEQERQAVINLEAARDKLKKSDADYATKLNTLNLAIQKHEQNLRNAAKTDQQRAEEARKASEKIIEAQRRERAEYERRKTATMDKYYSSNSSRALKFSTNAKTLEEEARAVKYLEAARAKLNTQDANYKKNLATLNAEIKRHKHNLDEAKKGAQELNNQHKGLLDTSGQLARAMTAVFSVSAIKGYVNKLMQIRGEFELQQRSLQVLLQNKDEANALWDKTVALAVKSPYTTKQLVTATKQLAAYRIESEKLYETNKMLADVSIGLGVDMNRLILAFGQVKAANFLRGTELRQFSEAGVNMLDELAKRFTALEGRAVSVGEVFERVSKRMVSFADVEAVFKTITSEGGTFYQMQEKQSETLKGMMLNLKDSYELMLNDIGKSNESTLKGFVSFMRVFVDGWREAAVVIKTAGTAMLFYFAASKIAKIGSAFSGLWAAMAANPVGAIAAGVGVLIGLFVSLYQHTNKLNEALLEVEKNVTASLEESIGLYRKLTDTINDSTASLDERNKAYEELKTKFKDILPDQKLELEYIQGLKFSYKEAEDAMFAYYNAKAIQQKKDKIESLYDEKIDKEVKNIVSATQKNIERIKNKITFEQYEDLRSGLDSIVMSVVMDAKKGLVALDDIESEITKRLSKFSDVTEEVLKSGYVKGSLVSSTYLDEDLEDLRDYLQERSDLLAKVSGLYFETSAQRDAYNAMQEHNKEMETAISLYKHLVLLRQKLADKQVDLTTDKALLNRQQLKDREWYLNDLNNTMAEIAKLSPYVAKGIQDIDKSLVNAAQKGSYEFAKSLGVAENTLYNIFADKAKGLSSADSGAAQMLTNFVEGIKANAESKLATPLQQAIISAFDLAIKERDIDQKGKDLLAKLLPDSKQTTEDVRKSVEALLKQYQDEVKKWENATAAGATKLPFVEYLNQFGNTKFKSAISQYLGSTEEFKNLEQKMIPVLEHIYKLLGGDPDKDKKGRSRDLVDERLRVIKEIYKAYKELNKTFDETTSKTGAMEKFGDAFYAAFSKTPEQMGYNLFTAEGVVDAYNKFISTLSKADDITKGNLAKGEFVMELQVERKQAADKQIADEIASMFDGYELSLELDKLNIPKDLASRLFGIEDIDLSDIRKRIEQEIYNAQLKGGQEDFIAKRKEELEKVKDMEIKQQRELLKTYSKYLVQAQSERIKIKLDELRQLKEIESLEIGDADKELMRQGVQKDIQKRLDTQAWKDFQESGMYVRLFDNLEGASMHSLDKMENALMVLRDSLKDLDPSELKEINNQLEKIRDIKVDKNPFKGLADDAKTYFEYVKNRKEWEASLDASEEKEANIRSEADSQSLLIKSLEDELDLIDQTTDEGIAYALVLESKVELEKEYLKVLLDELEAQGKITREERERIENGQDAGKSIQDRLNKTAQEISAVTSSMADMATNLEAAFGMSDSLKDTFELLQGIGGGVSDMFSGAAGLFSGNPLQMIQGGMQLVSGVSKIFASFNEAHDKRIERKIESEIKLVERLGKLYEKLEKQIEAAYSIDTFQAANDAAKENLEQQIRATERMIEAEKDKKKTDQKRIEEWQEQIEENLEMLEELEAKRLQELGGIGGENAYKDITQGLTDAWFDAFLETGNGLDALNDHFDEVLNNMVKKQLTLRATNSFLAPIFEEIDKAVKDTKVTNEEMQNIKELAAQTMPELAAFLENIATEMGMSEYAGKNGALSGLSAGISGITETQADIISAYLNSLRFYVADSNMQLKALVAAQGVNADTPNPMLSQLLVIAEQTRSIRDMFESVIGRGGNNKHGGAYLKVDIG